MSSVSSATATPAKPTGPSPVTVVVCVDATYAPLALVLAASMALTATGRRPIVLHVMYCGPDLPVLRQLSAFAMGPVSIVVRRLENPLGHLPSQDRFPPIIYLRLLMAELLPECDRALYLDVDTILLGDVGELFDAELGGQPLGAVRDLGIWLHRDAPAHNSLTAGTISDYLRVTRPNLQAVPLDYFNSGVLLMDLAQWRQRGLSGVLTGAAAGFAGHKWPDQDLLNAEFEGKVAWLDPRWNVMIEPILRAGAFLDAPDVVRHALARQIERPGLAHFSNAYRPWLREDELPFGALWWAAAEHADAVRYFERVAEPAPAPEPIEAVVLPLWRRALNRIARATSVLLRGYV